MLPDRKPETTPETVLDRKKKEWKKAWAQARKEKKEPTWESWQAEWQAVEAEGKAAAGAIKKEKEDAIAAQKKDSKCCVHCPGPKPPSGYDYPNFQLEYVCGYFIDRIQFLCNEFSRKWGEGNNELKGALKNLEKVLCVELYSDDYDGTRSEHCQRIMAVVNALGPVDVAFASKDPEKINKAIEGFYSATQSRFLSTEAQAIGAKVVAGLLLVGAVLSFVSIFCPALGIGAWGFLGYIGMAGLCGFVSSFAFNNSETERKIAIEKSALQVYHFLKGPHSGKSKGKTLLAAGKSKKEILPIELVSLDELHGERHTHTAQP